MKEFSLLENSGWLSKSRVGEVGEVIRGQAGEQTRGGES